MFSKVSVLVPTRERIPRLATMLASYDETTRGMEEFSEVVLRVDEDDKETQDFLLERGGLHLVIGSRHSGYRSMPVFFNEMLAAAKGDVLMCGNDDMVFRTPSWAPAILAAANQYPDGLFNFGVATLNETHYPFSIVSRKAVECMGFIWDPRIFWGDMFLRDVMATFGRSIMLPSIRIDHVWAGDDPDALFLSGRPHKATIETDPTYWINTHARAVSEAVEKLKVLA